MRGALACLAAWAALTGCAPPAPPPEQALCPWRDPPARLFRHDRDPEDAPWGAEDLLRDFERAVFFTEFTTEDGEVRRGEREEVLARWEAPIRYRLGGDSIGPNDPARFRAVAARLANATGLEITEAQEHERADLVVTIASRAQRLQLADALEPLRGAQTEGLIYRLRSRDPYTLCTASAAYDPESLEIVSGAILIRGEAGEGQREICAEEEFAQILGPANDDPCARPSIFNDDAEFALLTRHDEALLRLLYDPQLQSGMRRDEAMPVARKIVQERRFRRLIAARR